MTIASIPATKNGTNGGSSVIHIVIVLFSHDELAKLFSKQYQNDDADEAEESIEAPQPLPRINHLPVVNEIDQKQANTDRAEESPTSFDVIGIIE
jgi:hypothetical protein